MSDEEIDQSDIPELDESFFERATVTFPPSKQQLTIRLDTDILKWLKGQGRGYQTRINAILRAYYEAHKHETAARP
ncbi:MAG: BrnA antitoxin family protein [Candidatus Tectomicrobia bacterium]|nr:BrnA antitoxin family protein [Candidatus Tectomicrobia bacterium]